VGADILYSEESSVQHSSPSASSPMLLSSQAFLEFAHANCVPVILLIILAAAAFVMSTPSDKRTADPVMENPYTNRTAGVASMVSPQNSTHAIQQPAPVTERVMEINKKIIYCERTDNHHFLAMIEKVEERYERRQCRDSKLEAIQPIMDTFSFVRAHPTNEGEVIFLTDEETIQKIKNTIRFCRHKKKKRNADRNPPNGLTVFGAKNNHMFLEMINDNIAKYNEYNKTNSKEDKKKVLIRFMESLYFTRADGQEATEDEAIQYIKNAFRNKNGTNKRAATNGRQVRPA
jgi:hypothetical protein